MTCEHCTEFLADFLLDELPETEAVLIQEHLNLCPACMKTYRELKGTGKALEAVPAMRPVKGTPDFTRTVRAEAAVESAKIIEALPPDKRLRVEARRAARLGKFASQRSTEKSRSRVWGVVLSLVVGFTALYMILFTGRNGLLTPHTQLGTLSLISGDVQTGNAHDSRTREAHEGETIYAGDTVVTPENGRARVDLNDGTALFIGPTSHVTLDPQSASFDAFSVVVENGELGVNKPLNNPDKNAPRTLLKWDIQSELGLLLPDPGTQLFVSLTKNGGSYNGSALVITGSAIVVSRHSGTEVTTTLGPGSKYLEGGGQGKGHTESVTGARVPEWRVELASEADLQRLVNGRVKVRGRSSAGVEVEVTYNRDTKQLADDWITEPAGPNTISKRADGAIVVPNAKFVHAIPFAGPVSITLTLCREVRPERSLAFGVLSAQDRGVSVDVASNAVLQVLAKREHVHSTTVHAKKEADKPERLALDVKTERGGLSAVVSTSEEKSTGDTLPPEFSNYSGQVWLQALSDGITMDEIKLTGTIPADWLSEALSRLGKP